ncbi:MAG: tetratricopeptide repeat protein [Nitrospirota bacterium]
MKANGLAAYRRKDFAAALHCLKQALAVDPHDARIHYLLGNILREKGDSDQALIHYQEALRIHPHFAEAYNNLGLILQGKGLLDEAITCYEKALKANPALTGIYYNLGTVFHDKKDLEKAAQYYQKAIEHDPRDADAHYNLANVLRELKSIDDALLHYRGALALNPELADAYNNMGSILSERGLFHDAVTCYLNALRLSPNVPDIYSNLGIVFKEQGRLDKAAECFETALKINPSFVEALNNMAGVLLDRGDVSGAERCLEKALRIKSLPVIYSSLLCAMNYSLLHSPQEIYTEHVNYSKLFAEPLLSDIAPHTNELKANRRLRIGYISPDFRRHSVAYFIEPILASHDRRQVEVFCYSDVIVPDGVTQRLQRHSDQWRAISGMSDQDVAALIHSDGIDILVDLAGHTERNRMLALARRPAPVQATWIGYPATTGLQTMDYKIVDARTDPPGLTEQFYTEKLIRLPETFLCYRPPEDSPEVGDCPALSAGHVTFGSFNNYPKISPETLSLWIKILKAVPHSRLILKARSLADTKVTEELIAGFVREDIDRARIEFCTWKSSTKDHLDLYNRIDIALDTFPYDGTTTTCEALWMGVPVITLAGIVHASRVGTSLLTTVGMPELVADSEEEYARKAVDLARDTDRLRILRKSLRDMMLRSPLTDAKRFTANLEDSYRNMWVTWCKNEHR